MTQINFTSIDASVSLLQKNKRNYLHLFILQKSHLSLSLSLSLSLWTHWTYRKHHDIDIVNTDSDFGIGTTDRKMLVLFGLYIIYHMLIIVERCHSFKFLCFPEGYILSCIVVYITFRETQKFKIQILNTTYKKYVMQTYTCIHYTTDLRRTSIVSLFT